MPKAGLTVIFGITVIHSRTHLLLRESAGGAGVYPRSQPGVLGSRKGQNSVQETLMEANGTERLPPVYGGGVAVASPRLGRKGYSFGMDEVHRAHQAGKVCTQKRRGRLLAAISILAS